MKEFSLIGLKIDAQECTTLPDLEIMVTLAFPQAWTKDPKANDAIRISRRQHHISSNSLCKSI